MGKDVVFYICIYIYVYVYIYTHTHSAILLSHKNEILPLAATWMDLELVNITKKEADSQVQRSNQWLPAGRGKQGGPGGVGETDYWV